MSFTAYARFEGESGVIKGFTGEEEKSSDGKSIKDMSRVQSYCLDITIPTHQQTGEAQGPGKVSPLEITIDCDCSIPELYRSMTLNKRLKEVKVYFFRSGAGERASGKPNELFHNWYTVSIQDCRIVRMEQTKPMVLDPERNLPDLMKVAFSFYKIKWEDHDDKKETEWEWKKKAG